MAMSASSKAWLSPSRHPLLRLTPALRTGADPRQRARPDQVRGTASCQIGNPKLTCLALESPSELSQRAVRRTHRSEEDRAWLTRFRRDDGLLGDATRSSDQLGS